ncbi:hypothetical protein DICVIV_05556 [Dictyocaulus viviparus]|uniref:Uncharacterized protein n=1 Tax=Dictyocaulus viviparus TaxID=29172 RepID=A0A0D8XUY4_DICVI|nr:hypothetical protein DICVIV_05556 [Dictyocaulus viviparus]
MVGSYEDDVEDGDSDTQDEYLSRRNLEKARMERLRREKEERDRLKEMEERRRRSTVRARKGRHRQFRCGSASGRNTSRTMTSSQRNPPIPSTPSVVTRSMSRRLRGW